jgi:hypothetical protein
MDLYSFHDLTLEAEGKERKCAEELTKLLGELSWVKTQSPSGKPSLSLTLDLADKEPEIPAAARQVSQPGDILGLHDFYGFESGDDFYLTDGSSVFRLESSRGRGYAHLSSSFFARPPVVRQSFLAFGLLSLLRPLGLYSIHAAGVLTANGLGLLIVGASGSGKSTLSIGLIRKGWRYLSDETVLLRDRHGVVEALALRKNFYVDLDAVPRYSDLPLGAEIPDMKKRTLLLAAVYPGQYTSSCTPQVLLFPRVVPEALSRLFPLDRVQALAKLLEQSGLQSFDRATMSQQLDVLKRLLQQTVAYELRSGRDLYDEPLKLVGLLAEAERENRWPSGLSSS